MLSKDQITKVCKDEGLNPHDPMARKKASQVYKKKEVEDWMRTERDRATPTSHESSKSPVVLSSLTPSQINARQGTSGKRPEDAAVASNPGEALGDDIPIDPQLLAPTMNLVQLLMGSSIRL